MIDFLVQIGWFLLLIGILSYLLRLYTNYLLKTYLESYYFLDIIVKDMVPKHNTIQTVLLSIVENLTPDSSGVRKRYYLVLHLNPQIHQSVMAGINLKLILFSVTDQTNTRLVHNRLH